LDSHWKAIGNIARECSCGCLEVFRIVLPVLRIPEHYIRKFFSSPTHLMFFISLVLVFTCQTAFISTVALSIVSCHKLMWILANLEHNNECPSHPYSSPSFVKPCESRVCSYTVLSKLGVENFGG